jgi:hypothetical protein
MGNGPVGFRLVLNDAYFTSRIVILYLHFHEKKNSRILPSSNDIKLWTNSLADLLRDPLGVKTFSEFVKIEFSSENLEFHLAVEELGSLQDYDLFTQASIKIFDEYIAVGAPKELNITSSCRSQLTSMFAELKRRLGVTASSSPTSGVTQHDFVSDKMDRMSIHSTSTSATTPAASRPMSHYHHPGQFDPTNLPEKWRLPNSCFVDAHDHILALMSKDSYVRFLASDMMSKLQQQVLNGEAEDGHSMNKAKKRSG